jgi:hypothetical protein
MTIPIELTPVQEDALRSAAQRLGISAENLARLAVEDLLDKPAPDFEATAQRVLERNRDLY